jgi:hypothetical protein
MAEASGAIGQRVQLLMPLAEETAARKQQQQQHVAAACRASRTPEASPVTGAGTNSDALGAGQQQLQPAASSKHGGPFSSFQQVDLLGTLDSAAAAGTDTQLPANVQQGERTCASSGAASHGPALEAAAAAIDDTDAADMLLSFASADMPDSTALPSSDTGNEGVAGGGAAQARQVSADADAEGQARGAKRLRATAAAAGGSSGDGYYWQEVQRRLAFYGCCDAMQRSLAGPAPDSVRAAAATQAGFADDDEAPPPLHELPAHEAAVVRSLLHGGLPTTSGLLNGSAAGQQEQQEPYSEQQRRGSSAMSGGEQLGLLSTGSGRPASQLLQFVAAAIVDEQQSHGSSWRGLGEAAVPAAAVDGQPGWLAAAAGSDGGGGYAAAAAAAAGGGAAGISNRRGGGGSRSGRSRGGGPHNSSTRGSRGQGTAAAAGDDGEAGSAAGKFVLRSSKYTGIYRSRRTNEGWRAQFCASNKASCVVMVVAEVHLGLGHIQQAAGWRPPTLHSCLLPPLVSGHQPWHV